MICENTVLQNPPIIYTHSVYEKKVLSFLMFNVNNVQMKHDVTCTTFRPILPCVILRTQCVVCITIIHTSFNRRRHLKTRPTGRSPWLIVRSSQVQVFAHKLVIPRIYKFLQKSRNRHHIPDDRRVAHSKFLTEERISGVTYGTHW